jgi:hypothetical protein
MLRRVENIGVGHGFVATLAVEVFVQLQSQLAGMDPDGAIFYGAVIPGFTEGRGPSAWMALSDMYRNSSRSLADF